MKLGKQLDRDKTSHMKAAFAHFNNQVKQKEEKRIYLNHEETKKYIEVDRIFNAFGAHLELLPDELKSYGAEKVTNKRKTVNDVDVSLIKTNVDNIRQGKQFSKRVKKYVYEQQLEMFAERTKNSSK